MVSPRRPALGAVLDALTTWEGYDVPPSDRVALGGAAFGASAWSESVVMGVAGGNVEYRWITADPAEAWERLQTIDLIPLDYRGRFVCEGCAGGGVVAVGIARLPCLRCALPCAECCGSERVGGAVCECVGSLRQDAVALGHLPHPPTVAALVSWASLGFAASDDGSPGILGAEELMGELSPGTPTRWRVTRVADIPTNVFRNESAQRLNAAGFGWSGGGRYRTLYVPPLGAP